MASKKHSAPIVVPPAKKRGRPGKVTAPPASLIEKIEQVADVGTPIEGPRWLDGVMHFSENDLIRYENCELKALNTFQSIGLKIRELENGRAEWSQREKSLQIDVEVCRAHAKAAKEAVLKLQGELGARYKIADFSKVTYDDKTGRIRIEGVDIEVAKP